MIYPTLLNVAGAQLFVQHEAVDERKVIAPFSDHASRWHSIPDARRRHAKDALLVNIVPDTLSLWDQFMLGRRLLKVHPRLAQPVCRKNEVMDQNNKSRALSRDDHLLLVSVIFPLANDR